MTKEKMTQEILGMEGNIETNVDIVFAIDVTDSTQPIIDMVKDAALSFHENLDSVLKEAKRSIHQLRIKVIWFRDFYYDGDYAYGESKFFELPEEADDFRNFVKSIEAKGGGDAPESGLEALTMAMRSDFVQEGEKKRHIVVLFTDDAAHPFEDFEKLTEEAAKLGCRPTMYPENMPKDITEFYRAWEGDGMCQDVLGCDGETTKLDKSGRRLVLFAPNDYPWCDMELELTNVLRKDIEPEKGGKELDMDDVYSMIACSIA